MRLRQWQNRMMRFVLALILGLAALPALAQVWTHYPNTRFAYSLDIPPGFVGEGESANGDGQVFYVPNGLQELRAWGGLLGVATETFPEEATARLQSDMGEGWAITYQAGTPQWAVWSGMRNGYVLYQRMILLCDGQSYAAFRLTHPAADTGRMHGVVEGLVRSLRPEC
jgi:hypothetical protein